MVLDLQEVLDTALVKATFEQQVRFAKQVSGNDNVWVSDSLGLNKLDEENSTDRSEVVRAISAGLAEVALVPLERATRTSHGSARVDDGYVEAAQAITTG
jgi:hypothetical protein